MSLLIPTSYADIIDRITILHIKTQNIKDPVKYANVTKEYNAILEITNKYMINTPERRELVNKLRKINQKLWDLEDKIRLIDEDGCYDSELAEVAREIYKTNDQRCALKREINEIYGSELIEEKSYW